MRIKPKNSFKVGQKVIINEFFNKYGGTITEVSDRGFVKISANGHTHYARFDEVKLMKPSEATND